MRPKIPGAHAQEDSIILPGKDKERGGDDPTIVLQEGIREVTATTLAEEHQGLKGVHTELQENEGSEDWGDGFTAFPEPAHILRGPDGGITSVVPLSEIPGVELGHKEEEALAMIADSKPTPVPLNRKQRHQLVAILASRLFKYYGQLTRDHPGYNPFRDGIPSNLSERDGRNVNPTAYSGVDLKPATDQEIYDWLYKFIGARTSVINKRRFGTGIQDLALRIE